MANTILGNKILIDSTGEVTTTRQKIAYILFTPNANNDEFELKETASGDPCFYIRANTGKQTSIYRMPEVPLVFNNGIYVSILTAGAKVVLVTTNTGG